MTMMGAMPMIGRADIKLPMGMTPAFRASGRSPPRRTDRAAHHIAGMDEGLHKSAHSMPRESVMRSQPWRAAASPLRHIEANNVPSQHQQVTPKMTGTARRSQGPVADIKRINAIVARRPTRRQGPNESRLETEHQTFASRMPCACSPRHRSNGGTSKADRNAAINSADQI